MRAARVKPLSRGDLPHLRQSFDSTDLPYHGLLRIATEKRQSLEVVFDAMVARRRKLSITDAESGSWDAEDNDYTKEKHEEWQRWFRRDILDREFEKRWYSV